MLSRVLSYLPALLSSVDDLSVCDKEQVMCMAKLANAGLAALGGFNESIKPGCQVQVSVVMEKLAKKFILKGN